MNIPSSIATIIAEVLNTRGFVTHDDFPICTDGVFGDLLCRNEQLLRESGYTGGQLHPWSTSFRLSLTFTYGVMNSDRSFTNERLDAYTLASGDFLEESGLLVADLQPLLIGLRFRCDCGEVTKIVNSTISYPCRSRRIHTVSASCAACNIPISSHKGSIACSLILCSGVA